VFHENITVSRRDIAVARRDTVVFHENITVSRLNIVVSH